MELLDLIQWPAMAVTVAAAWLVALHERHVAARKFALEARQRLWLHKTAANGPAQRLGHELARRADDGQHASPVGDPHSRRSQFRQRHDLDGEPLDIRTARS